MALPIKKSVELKKKLIKLEKQASALRATAVKHQRRLDASQNALRIVEQAIGGKLVEGKRRS
jgi:hypothetical protein